MQMRCSVLIGVQQEVLQHLVAKTVCCDFGNTDKLAHCWKQQEPLPEGHDTVSEAFVPLMATATLLALQEPVAACWWVQCYLGQ